MFADLREEKNRQSIEKQANPYHLPKKVTGKPSSCMKVIICHFISGNFHTYLAENMIGPIMKRKSNTQGSS